MSELEDIVTRSLRQAREDAFDQGFRAGHAEGAETQRRFIMEDSGAHPFDDDVVRDRLDDYKRRVGPEYVLPLK